MQLSHTFANPQIRRQAKAWKRVCILYSTDKETKRKDKLRQREGQLVTTNTQEAGLRVKKIPMYRDG